eukprot:876507_1
MKIKIVYGIDMRLWRYNLTTDKPQPSVYDDLLTYVCKTFGFTDRAQLVDLGQWVLFQNIWLDNETKQLKYDEHSVILDAASGDICFDERHRAVHDKKLDMLTWNVYQNAVVVTDVSAIHPHHHYQAFTIIHSVKDINTINCKYRIMGKAVKHNPKKCCNWIQWDEEEDCLKRIVFGLVIQDASGGSISPIPSKKLPPIPIFHQFLGGEFLYRGG